MAVMTGSICDRCRDPGRCCRDFPLPGVRVADHPTALHAAAYIATLPYDQGRENGPLAVGFPFVPLRTEDGYWRFRCLDLLPDGRCGNYEHRPYGPCVLYQPGQDQLCAHGVKQIGMCTDGARSLK